MTTYRVPFENGESAFTEKRSRFISHIWRVETEAEARERIEEMKKRYYDARHNCWCYLLQEGGVVRYSDDGEPQGTAGQPMLNVFQRESVTNVCCVVTRYFGGVLLGTGGLVRAYTTATSRALEAAEVVTVRSVVALDVTVDYGLYERADLLIKAAGGKLAEPEFTDKVTLRWQMPEHTEGPLLTQLLFTRKNADDVRAACALEERLLAQVPVWLLQNRGDAASAALCRDTLMEAQT